MLDKLYKKEYNYILLWIQHNLAIKAKTEVDMKNLFFGLVMLFTLFSLNSAVFADDLTPCPAGASCSENYILRGGVTQTPIVQVAEVTSNSQLVLKQVEIRGTQATIHFQPGPVKYVASYSGKEMTLVPTKHYSKWNEGHTGVAMMHTFRASSYDGGFDELWLSAKKADFGDGDITVTLNCFFQDGSLETKKVRVVKGASRIISISEDEIVIALQPKNEKL